MAESKYKTLNIIQSHNAQIFKTHLKHNSFISALSSSLNEKLPDEEQTLSEISLSKTNLQVSSAFPFSKPFHWEPSPDKCFQLIREKAEYKKKLEKYRHFYAKDKNKLTLNSLQGKKEQLVNVPHYLVDLAIHGDKNPYFDGDYDYFYAGGNLAKVHVNNEDFLLSVQNEKCLVLTNLHNEVVQETEIIKAPIYNLKTHNTNDTSYVTLRSKREIQIELFLNKTFHNQEVKTKTIYSQKQKIPYIDISMHSTKLATANVAYEVKIFDIERKNSVISRQFDIAHDQTGDLCQLELLTLNNLLFMDRNNILLVDLRDIINNNFPKKAILKKGYFQCNDLCAFCKSSLEANYIYVASKHNIFKVDLREMQVVKKWSHLLDNSPIVIKVLQLANEEVIFVSSFNETVCLLVGGNNHMPFKVSNIAETYYDYKLHKEFLIREDFEERFKLSTTGLEVHNSQMFTVNSIGDVFKHIIDANNVLDQSQSIKKLSKEFIAKIPEKPKQLQVTHLKEMSGLKSILMKRCKEEKLNSYHEPNKRLKKFLNPEIKFGMYDMSTIWASERAVIDTNAVEEPEKIRIDSWLAQSTLADIIFDPVLEDIDIIDDVVIDTK